MGRNVSSIIVAVTFFAIVLIFGLQLRATQTTERTADTANLTPKTSIDTPSDRAAAQSSLDLAIGSSHETPPQAASPSSPTELPPIEFEGRSQEEIMAQVYERERAFAASQGKLAEFEEQKRVRSLKREERRRIREEFRSRNNALNEQHRQAHRSAVETRRGMHRADETSLQADLREEKTLLREETQQALQEANTLN
jgi:hypothetical protein